MVGPSHGVPGQEASSQGHAGGQQELEAGPSQHGQGCSEGAAAAFQGTCAAAPRGHAVSRGRHTRPGCAGHARPTFVQLSSVVGALPNVSFPVVHGKPVLRGKPIVCREPILQGLFGQQGASLVQFIEYLQVQRINSRQRRVSPEGPSRRGRECTGRTPPRGGALGRVAAPVLPRLRALVDTPRGWTGESRKHCPPPPWDPQHDRLRVLSISSKKQEKTRDVGGGSPGRADWS